MKYTENYTVTSHDVDVNNNLRPSMFLRYMQETANHQMRDRKPSYYDLFFEGKSFVVTRMSVEIHGQIHQYEDITVKTWRCPEKGATFIRCYSIEHGSKTIAVAYSEWAVANRNTGKLCRASEVDISNYETDQIPDMSIEKKFRFPKDTVFENIGHKTIMYSNVDMNLHMNNTNYPNMICDYIPDIMKKEVTSMNFRFMAEGPLNENIDIYMSKLKNPLKTDLRAEETYLFKTFVGERTNIEAEIGVKRTDEYMEKKIGV